MKQNKYAPRYFLSIAAAICAGLTLGWSDAASAAPKAGGASSSVGYRTPAKPKASPTPKRKAAPKVPTKPAALPSPAKPITPGKPAALPAPAKPAATPAPAAPIAPVKPAASPTLASPIAPSQPIALPAPGKPSALPGGVTTESATTYNVTKPGSYVNMSASYVPKAVPTTSPNRYSSSARYSSSRYVIPSSSASSSGVTIITPPPLDKKAVTLGATIILRPGHYLWELSAFTLVQVCDGKIGLLLPPQARIDKLNFNVVIPYVSCGQLSLAIARPGSYQVVSKTPIHLTANRDPEGTLPEAIKAVKIHYPAEEE